ncbi:ligand-dependent nuclear receptor corepressor-like protein [Diadema antillarum]|uniref:ligand-dependent nuclear receptor corepressor-like protein n=1 Tax=Diadema antillarum TaxID=105358 RepID=UPI003A89162E
MKMAEYVKCGNQRCLQERKQLRKELDRGRKNLTSYIGLECVIESLFGSDFFQKVSPFKAQDDTHEHEPCDWQGEKENCAMCKARQEIVQESIARHEAYMDSLEEGKEGSRHVTSQERVLRAQQWLAKSVPMPTVQPAKKPEQPLDLSKNGLEEDLEPAEEEEDEDGDGKASMLKVPAIVMQRTSKTKTARSCRINGSSSYTQDDLKLALKEVRQGKLGTRRASVLYGIPRSTIRNHLNRNKVNRQEEAEEESRVVNVEEVEMKIPKRMPYMVNNVGKQEKVERNAVPVPNLAFPFTALFQQYQQQGHAYEDCSTDEVVAKLRNFLQGRSAGGSGKLPKSAGFDHGLDQALVRELVMTCTKVGSLETVEDLQQRHSSASSLEEDKLPNQVFQHLIGRLLETEKVRLLSGKKDVRQHIGIASVIRQPSSPSCEQNQDVKVPCFKPVVCDVNGAQLQDKMHSYDSSSSSHGSPTKSYSPSCNNNNNQASHCASYDSQVPASSKRPKRGRYRCYDRDSLIQAVNAVQRGEMSVTRAGNVFGVPHSTLEYKVKERHLKRMAKKGPSGSQQSTEKAEPSQTPILGVPPGIHLHDGHTVPGGLATARPYESFAEKLRAMSEKQALQNSYSYLRQQLEAQPALLAGHGLGLALTEADRYRLEEAQSTLAAHTQLAQEQWAQWLAKPIFSTPFFNIYTPQASTLGIDPTGMLYRMEEPKQSSSKKPSVSDAINRLVEAHLYSSLYNRPFSATPSDHDLCAARLGESSSSRQEPDPTEDQRVKRRAAVEERDGSPQPKKALKT